VRGTTILEIVIATAVVGTGVAALATLFGGHARLHKRMSGKFDRASIIRFLDDNLSCSVTVRTNYPNATALQNGHNKLAKIYDRLGNVIVSDDPAAPTRIGDFTLRATANTTSPPLGFNIEVARPRNAANPLANGLPDSAFFSDPMYTSVPLRWNSPQSSLYPAGAFPCATQFVVGCVRSCPPGSVMTGIDPDTRCVTCEDVTCPVGQFFQGLDGTTNKRVCLTPVSPCPSDQLRIGNDCVPVSAPTTTSSLLSRVTKRLEVQCHLVTDTVPSKSPLSQGPCDPATEFVASAGANCVNDSGTALYGLVKGTDRYPGYIHTTWPLNAAGFETDCYGTPGDPAQGRVTRHAVCCKYQLGHAP
jgi:hypothetical protein